MIDKGNRRGVSELVKLLDAHATWVVRTKSGVIGNASSLRAALDVAARKSNEKDPLDSIDSVTRFDGTRIHIPRRQARQLLQPNGTSLILSRSDPPTLTERTRHSWLGWAFSRGKSANASSSRTEHTDISVPLGSAEAD
jgi:hypothetical protein